MSDRFLLLPVECGENTCMNEPGKQCDFLKAGLHCAFCRLFEVQLSLEFGKAIYEVERCEACRAAELR